MTRKDWVTTGIRIDLAEGIDMFLKTTEARDLNLKSRQEFLNVLVRQYLEKFENSHGKRVLINKSDCALFDIINNSMKTKKIWKIGDK